MTDISTVARAQSLLDELAAARADAVRWDFDLPSDLAYQRAESLLRMLCRSSIPTETLEVAVGVDGVIEVTMYVGHRYYIIDVEPAGDRIQMISRNTVGDRISSPSEVVDEIHVVQRLERAQFS